MEKQQTAVEWLIDTINKINHDYEVGIIDEAIWSIQTYDAHKQAKEMDKRNTISFGYSCVAEIEVKKGNLIYNKVPEEIYIETFKSE